MEHLKVVEINGIEYLIAEEIPYQPVEFRVYYDDFGNILFYTCDKIEGNYLVVESQIYAESRFDLKVVDGKLTKISPGTIIRKYKPSTEGISCSVEDISIVDDSNNTTKWKLTKYEL
jgi:hypothetical protein